MRYLNLACLLMTLVCLVTILLFSKSSFVNNERSLANLESSAASRHGKRTPSGGSWPSGSSAPDEDEGAATTSTMVESIEALGKQALVNGPDSAERDKWGPLGASSQEDAESEAAEETGASGSDEEQGATSGAGFRSRDGFNLFDEQPSSSRRELSTSSARAPTQHQEGEREESSGASTSAAGPRQQLGLGDPFFGNLFDDLDGSALFRAMRSQIFSANGEPGSSSLRPIIRRDKNGATIIIGGSLRAANGSLAPELADAPLAGGLLERLFPLGRPGSGRLAPTATLSRTVQGPGSFGATITIRSSGPLGELPAPLSMMMMRGPLGQPAEGEDSGPAARFIVRSSGASPLLAGPLLPPPSLLGMLLGAALRPPTLNATVTRAASEPPQVNATQSQQQQLEPLSAQASQLPVKTAANQTVSQIGGAQQTGNGRANNSSDLETGSNQVNSNQSSPKETDSDKDQSGGAGNAENENDVELFDVAHLPRASPPGLAHSTSGLSRLFGFGGGLGGAAGLLPVGPSGANSMIVISSGSSALAEPLAAGSERSAYAHAHAGPFGGPPVLMLSRARGHTHMPLLVPAAGELPPAALASPFLRSILGQVMSDLSAAGISERADAAEPGDWQQQQQSERPRGRQAGAKLAQQASSPRGQQQQQMNAAAAAELDSGEEFGAPAGSLAEQLFGPAAPEARFSARGASPLRLSLAHGPLVRQTIVRPGLTIERLVAPDEQGMQLVQQVGPKVRSQSISRMDGGAGEPSEQQQQQQQSPQQQQQQAEQQAAEQHSGRLFERLLGPESAGRRLDAGDLGAPLFMSGSGPMFAASLGSPFRTGRQLVQASPDQDADQEDADQDQEQPDNEDSAADEQLWSPSFRVARARLTGSAHELAAAKMGPGSPPVHFSLPASMDSPADQRAQQRLSEGQQLEQRLNEAISAAAEAAAAASRPQAMHEEPRVAEKQQQQSEQQQKQQQQAPARRAQPADFTSPSSPLFGFPAPQLQAAKQNHDKSNTADKQASEKRPFVYHSNIELAKPFAAEAAQHDQSQAQARSAAPTGQPQQQPQLNKLPPPASTVMGRRLDDGPAAPEDQQQQQQQAQQRQHQPTPLRSMGMNARQLEQPISLSAGGDSLSSISPRRHDETGPRGFQQTVSAEPFRTIVV